MNKCLLASYDLIYHPLHDVVSRTLLNQIHFSTKHHHRRNPSHLSSKSAPCSCSVSPFFRFSSYRASHSSTPKNLRNEGWFFTIKTLQLLLQFLPRASHCSRKLEAIIYNIRTGCGKPAAAVQLWQHADRSTKPISLLEGDGAFIVPSICDHWSGKRHVSVKDTAPCLLWRLNTTNVNFDQSTETPDSNRACQWRIMSGG